MKLGLGEFAETGSLWGHSIPSSIPAGCWLLSLQDLQALVSSAGREFLKTISDCWAGPLLPLQSLECLPVPGSSLEVKEINELPSPTPKKKPQSEAVF